MNPATDVGKKQLPTGLRSRFTEFVVDEISSPHDLATLIGDYLRELNLTALQVTVNPNDLFLLLM
jgi:midasin